MNEQYELQALQEVEIKARAILFDAAEDLYSKKSVKKKEVSLRSRATFETKNTEGRWVNGARIAVSYAGKQAPFKLDPNRTPSMQSKERSEPRRGKGHNAKKRATRAECKGPPNGWKPTPRKTRK